jgi:hypothetical protein
MNSRRGGEEEAVNNKEDCVIALIHNSYSSIVCLETQNERHMRMR